jgi:curved DNA-binding protein
MKRNQQFVDYYEVFEASPNANTETIERLFRYLAKRLHPDVAVTGDVHRFSELVEAYHTLRAPEARAAYDATYEQEKQQGSELVEEAKFADSDTSQRHQMLSLFYAQRRREMKKPGVATTTLERLMGCPPEIVNFHLWYFREKAWIQREECGLLSITAEGVDKIEQMNVTQCDPSLPRLTVEENRVEQKSARDEHCGQSRRQKRSERTVAG